MNRRGVLACLPAAMFAPGRATAETPVMALFRVWKEAFDLAEGQALSGWTDAARQPFHDREAALLQQLVQTPAETAADVCAKITAFSCDGQFFADDDGFLSDVILREVRIIIHGRQA